MDGRYHRRDVSDVVDELASVSEKHVHLADDEPFVNHQRMSEMAECIEAAGIEKEYYAYCRIDTFLKNRDLMARCRTIGLRRLFFGIEAIFDHELDQYKKRQARDQIVQGLKVISARSEVVGAETLQRLGELLRLDALGPGVAEDAIERVSSHDGGPTIGPVVPIGYLQRKNGRLIATWSSL
jgi:hypothetical protein